MSTKLAERNFRRSITPEVIREHTADGCCIESNPCSVVKVLLASQDNTGTVSLDSGDDGIPAARIQNTGSNYTSHRPARMSTEKQNNFISSLIDQREIPETGGFQHLLATFKKNGELPRMMASDLIGWLKELPYARPISTPVIATARPQTDISKVTVGLYMIGETVYRVVQNQAKTRLYAEMFDGENFNYDKGAIYRIAENGQRLTVEQAEEISRKYARCMMCKRHLTNEKSIARGVGPICRAKIAG